MEDNRETSPDVAANGHPRIRQVPSGSSIESNCDALQIAGPSRSEDLDKLSLCLSEAASEAGADGEQSSLFNEVLQSQLAFWTLVISVFYTYAWQQHRKKFLFSLMMIALPLLLICLTLSTMLGIIVVTGWLCSTPMKFGDVLTIGDGDDGDGLNSMSASRSNLAGGRRRTMSGNRASMFSHLSRRFNRSGAGPSASVGGRSSSCEDLTLPKPVCRKHSTEQSFSRGFSSAGGLHSGSRHLNYQHDLVRAASNNTVMSSFNTLASGLAADSASSSFSPIVEMKTPTKSPSKKSNHSRKSTTPDGKDHAKENRTNTRKTNGASGAVRRLRKDSDDSHIIPTDPPTQPFSSKN